MKDKCDKGNIMQLTCWAIESSGVLREVAEETALTGWRDGSGLYWIDLASDDAEAIIQWLTEFGLDSDIIATIRASDSTGRFLPLDDKVFFEYPAPDFAGNPNLFACICYEGLAISMHRQVSRPKHLEPLRSSIRLRDTSISGLVCALTVAHSTMLRRATLTLRDKAEALSETMDEQPESVPWEDILGLKRRVLELDRMTDEELAVFQMLGAMDKPHLNLIRLAEFFHLATANVEATDRRLERLDRAIRDLQQRYESVRQDKTNRRLGVLTIISAIFMPLTLIAGIYGMNFDVMPELHFRYSYPLTLAGMGVVAVLLFWYFRSRNWLK